MPIKRLNLRGVKRRTREHSENTEKYRVERKEEFLKILKKTEILRLKHTEIDIERNSEKIPGSCRNYCFIKLPWRFLRFRIPEMNPSLLFH